ncbi:MAG: hypothetical protein HYY64_14805 [Candidatus Rokubacteria bacterium]|nr:hypothetical protein [Candidatus Rokubacteria bacterium]
MLGLPESVAIFAAFTLAVSLALFAAAELLPRGTRIVSRTFLCPFRWTDVTVEFREDSFGHGRYLDVARCTAFPASPIGCGKLCRYLRDFPGPRRVPTIGA